MKTLIMAGVLLLALPAGAAAYYCGTSLITEGDRIEDVLAKCGRPAARQQGGQPFYPLAPAPSGHSSHNQLPGRIFGGPYVVTPRDAETLTYNCGEGTLIHVFTFWNGRLTRIETAGHGFGPGNCP
jgi:hypothetical protein